MEPIQDFSSLVSRLRAMKERKRVVVVCPNDPHTEYVIIRSLREGFADFLLVADTPKGAFISRPQKLSSMVKS